MDPMTASYYRAILFRDSQDSRPIPKSLMVLHAWAFKRFQAMGAGSVISKQAALCVAMQWLSSTTDGREFAKEIIPEIGDLFCAPENEEPASGGLSSGVNWDALPPETNVVVTIDDQPMLGHFVRSRGSGWVDVRIGDKTQKVRTKQVQLAGA